MKIASFFHTFVFAALLAVLFVSNSFGKDSDFEPTLQKALDMVVAQKNETEKAIRQIRKELDQSSAGKFYSGYNDMTDAFNRVIEIIRTGDEQAIATAAQNGVGNDVRLNRVWIEAVREINDNFFAKYPPIDEPAVANAWKTILQAWQALDKKRRKKLSKYLKKNAKWKTLSEIASELN